MKDNNENIKVLEREDIRPLFLPLKADAHKGDNGRLVIVGGSANYIGAPRLAFAGAAAMRSGLGTSTLAIPFTLAKSIYDKVLFSGLFPLSENDGAITFQQSEFELLKEGATAFAVGMGMANGDALGIVRFLMQSTSLNFVLDADGLKSGAGAVERYGYRAVFTPHPKEFAQISGYKLQDIISHPKECAKGFALEKEVILLLKGHESIITDGKRTAVNRTGNAKLSKGGSGDVLSGVIGALLARGFKPFECAAAGAFICGKAAELSTVNEFSHLPTDTVDLIPKAIDYIIGGNKT